MQRSLGIYTHEASSCHSGCADSAYGIQWRIGEYLPANYTLTTHGTKTEVRVLTILHVRDTCHQRQAGQVSVRHRPREPYATVSGQQQV